MNAPISIDDLRRRALSTGSELLIDGQTFNAGRQQMHVAPVKSVIAKPVSVALPPIAPPDSMTRAEVLDLLADRDEQWQQHIDQVTAAMVSTVQAAMVKPPSNSIPTAWDFSVKYDREGAITGIQARSKA